MFVNESVSDPVKTSVKLSGLEEVREGVWLDLLHGEEVRVPMENGRLSIELAPYQSAVAVFERTGEIPDLPAKKRWTRSEPADLTFKVEKALWTDLSSYEPVADKVSPDALFSLTAADRDPGFSGRIRYTARFEGKRESLALDLGEVGQTARLIINGKDLGERVCPPFRYDLTEALRDGENELVIEVSNTLANAVRDNFSMFMAIPASGLIGPVSWLREE